MTMCILKPNTFRLREPVRAEPLHCLHVISSSWQPWQSSAKSRVGPCHHVPTLSRTWLEHSPRKGEKLGNKCS